MQNWFGNGNLTAQPELKKVGQNQNSLVKFTVAINNPRKKEDGSWEDNAEFIRCEAWDAVAERVVKAASKGDNVLVQGRLKNNNWTTDDGAKRTDTVVRVDRFTVVRKKGGGAGVADVAHSVDAEPETETATEPESKEEIPF